MPEPFDKPNITRLLSELERKDRHRSVFGSLVHDYKLNPPIPVSTIEEFEARHGVRLPDDYRYFISEIGNGGAGPYYGLFPFGQQDDGLSWEQGDLVGDVSQPFPHVEAWNLPVSFWDQEPDIPPGTPLEEQSRLVEEWDEVEQEHYFNSEIMDGAIPICHLGCGLWQWLVVSGEQRGFIWSDYRADHRGIFPLLAKTGSQMTFSDWYMSWLTEAVRAANWASRVADLLTGGKKPRIVSFHAEQTGSEPGQAERAVESIAARCRVTSRCRDFLTLLGLIVAGVLLGLVIALLRK